MRKTGWIVLAVVTATTLAASSCSDDDGDSENAIQVTLRDFRIDLAKDTVPAGEVTFAVDNQGPSIHEFVVFRTDLGADDLPTDDAGDVAEGEDFEPVDEIEDIERGDDPELTVDLEAGSYVLICNIPGHYRLGMRTSFSAT
jgi:uncharacterized cupredoxin-like copper-binding protein